MTNTREYSIATRGGDSGETSLLDGTRVKKFSLRPDAYGTIDEANAFMGAFRASTSIERIQTIIIEVQNHIYYINSELACPVDKLELLKKRINENHLHYVDEQIQILEAELSLPRAFVLYGGTLSSSYADIARAIIRRSERVVSSLDAVEAIENVYIKKYLNRLSDLLFLLARYDEKIAGIEPLHPK